MQKIKLHVEDYNRVVTNDSKEGNCSNCVFYRKQECLASEASCSNSFDFDCGTRQVRGKIRYIYYTQK